MNEKIDLMEEMPEEHKRIIEQFERMAVITHSIFDTDHGKELLNHLEQETLYESITLENKISDRAQDIGIQSFSWMREGQNQVIRYLLRLINYKKENI